MIMGYDYRLLSWVIIVVFYLLLWFIIIGSFATTPYPHPPLLTPTLLRNIYCTLSKQEGSGHLLPPPILTPLTPPPPHSTAGKLLYLSYQNRRVRVICYHTHGRGENTYDDQHSVVDGAGGSYAYR